MRLAGADPMQAAIKSYVAKMNELIDAQLCATVSIEAFGKAAKALEKSRAK